MNVTGRSAPLELWAGFECTVARVGDRYVDQNVLSGHEARLSDLDVLADLGVRAVRYPILWERTAPHGLEHADWSWADARLGRLRALGIRPIVGLVHHGSGPRHTSLVDAAFPKGLAAFAGAVAARYPWVTHYTPVNEPLTTARFSGLYGYWFPHGHDDATFARALLTQCRAVALAMQAIRAVNPAAQLVQTDDLGKTYSTPTLAGQAAFDNERRWLSFDLLTGRLGPQSRLWRWLRDQPGVAEADLQWFQEHPCPPDVVGINHYLSSERFLDERLERYPLESHGGNGRQAYADVLAARVLADGPAGPGSLLREAWERYRLPLAITEAHNGCTREEQLRWVQEVWAGAESLRAEGADVRAVTAWSLLGAYDWDTMLTCQAGHYEPGVYDLRGPRPRPTALAALWRDLGAGRPPAHPVLAGPGWWRRPERLWYRPVRGRGPGSPLVLRRSRSAAPPARPLMIVGPPGALLHAVAQLCDLRGLAYHLCTQHGPDSADIALVEDMLVVAQPWAVFHAVVCRHGLDHVSDVVQAPNPTVRVGLARACARYDTPFLTLSCACAFDGTATRPYVESDPLTPRGAHARAVGATDAHLLAEIPSALVVRTGPLFDPWDDHDPLTVALQALVAPGAAPLRDAATVSPTYAPDLVHACLDLLVDGESGLWHLANEGAMTWSGLVSQAAERAGLDAAGVRTHGGAGRPAYRTLGSERGMLLPALDDAMGRYVDACGERWREPRRQRRA